MIEEEIKEFSSKQLKKFVKLLSDFITDQPKLDIDVLNDLNHFEIAQRDRMEIESNLRPILNIILDHTKIKNVLKSLKDSINLFKTVL